MYNIFSSFISKSNNTSPENFSKKTSLVSDILTPAIEIFTKITSTSSISPLKRLSEIEKQELIEEHSSLGKNNGQKTLSDLSDHLISLLGQIHADALIVNTPFEKLPSYVAASAWANLIKDVKEVSIPSSLLSTLEQYKKISKELALIKNSPKKIIKNAKDITEKVFDLKINESFLIEGGKTKDDIDCPIIYEFIRKSDTHFDLVVYHNGKEDGVRDLATEEGKKNWNKPIIHYQNIPADTYLFFGSTKETIKSDLFQSILETRFISNKTPINYVTLHLLGHIQSFRNTLPYISSARQAYSDAWSSIKPILLRILGREETKKAIFEIKLNSLIESYCLNEHTLGQDSQENEKLRIILKRGAQLILKNLASFHASGITISTPLFLKARATALDLIDKINEIECSIAKQRKDHSSNFTKPQIEKASLKGKNRDAIENAKKSVQKPNPHPGSIESTRARLINLPQEANEFSACIECFVNEYESSVIIPGIITAEIEHLVSLMPVPSNDLDCYWAKIPENELNSVLSSLDRLVVIYSKSFRKKNVPISPHESNTAFTLYAVIHYLAVKQDNIINDFDKPDNRCLAYYPIYFPAMNADEDSYLLFTSFDDYKRRNDLITYFKNTFLATKENKSDPLFAFNKNYQFHSNPEYHGGLESYLWALVHDDRFNDEITLPKMAEDRASRLGTISLPLVPDKVKRGWLASRLADSLNYTPSNDSIDKENLFAKKDLEHVPILARASILVHQFTSNGYHGYVRQEDFPRISTSFYPLTTFGVATDFSTTIQRVFEGKIDSEKLHPALRNDQKNILIQKWIKRNKSPDTTREEAEVLEKISKNVPSEAIALLTSSCEPSLFPHKLLSYYRNRLDLFESYDEQALFEIALFRSVALASVESESDFNHNQSDWKPYQSNRFHPLAEELKQKGFQEQVQLFIQEGLDRFYLRQPNQRPNVLAATLFLRMACRLSNFVDNTSFIDSLDYIDKMLATPDLTQKERCLLSIHRILAYSSLNRELTPNEIELIFGAWVYFKNTPLPEKWKNPLLEKEAETLIHKASLSLSNNQNHDFHRLILKTALKQMGIELPESFIVNTSEDHPHIITSKGVETSFWNVNILTGEVLCPDGILRRTTAPKGLVDTTFKYIFGDINPSYFQSSGCYYFSHPQIGTLRAIQVGNSDNYRIQRQINDRWYQYISSETYLKDIPRVLCGNHTHWINISPTLSDIIICERPNGNVIAQISANGEITNKSTSEKYWGFPQEHFFVNFERPEYIHFSELEGKNQKVIFSRYQSESNQTLSFEEDNNQLVYTSNRKYILSQKQYPGLLGATNGSLVLINKETNALKVLVPLKLLFKHNSLSSQHAIDVQDTHGGYGNLGEFRLDQRNRFDYLEFDVKQGALAPLNQEGICYLVYQYLAQRKYLEAFSWLKQVDFRDSISTNSLATLSRTIEIVGFSDYSPEASAIALHAWVLLKKASDRIQAEGKSAIIIPSIGDIRTIYSRFEHQIQENMLLNTKDREMCGIKDLGKKVICSYSDIQKFLPAPQRNLECIEAIDLENGVIKLYGAAGNIAGILNGSFTKSNFPSGCYDFEAILHQIKKIAFEATSFIPEKSVDSNYHSDYLHTKEWTIKFEQGFFQSAYEIARKGTELEKKQLAFRLQLIGEQDGSKPSSWRFLLLAFKYPTEAPDLPDPKDFKSRLEFVNKCAALYEAKKGEEYILDNLPRMSVKSISSKETLRPLSAPLFEPKIVQSITTPIELFSFSKEAIDNGFTTKIFNQFFVKSPKENKISIDAPRAPDKSSLEDNEQYFFNVLKGEFKEFSTDYQKGKEINDERQFYTLNDLKLLQSTLNTEISTLDSQLVDLESSILELANKHDPILRKQTLYKEAKIEQELSMKKLADLFLQGDAEAFIKANPYLRNSELILKIAQAYNLKYDDNLVIDYLYNKIALFMTISVHKNRLQRSLKYCKDIGLKTNDLEKNALIQKLADELKPNLFNEDDHDVKTIEKPVYSIKDYPAFLVFEYLSGLSIRPQQANLLSKLLNKDLEGNYVNRVIQLIMGGGKTSVMAVILLKLAARQGRLSLFVTPASQYASVSHNLRKTLRDCFGIDMEEIEVSREQLAKSSTMAHEILNRLQSAVRSGNFLLIKSETLQTIGLEFLDLVYQASKEKESCPDLIDKINILKDILILFRNQGDALFDEVDLLLNVLQEVNFPVGEPELVAPERIEVIRELFLLLVKDNVAISQEETVSLKEIIALKANKQNLVTQKTWKATVCKAVAWNLMQSMDSLKLQNRLEFRDSFYRYINGTMNVECQRVLDNASLESTVTFSDIDSIDYQFLRYLKQLSRSKDPTEKEAANHIALIKHMMQTVLPGTFEKTGKRNYGRGGTQPGEVRPYLAVDTPSENLFGYHWEAVAYHFQTALQCGISLEQMLNIAQVYKAQAQAQSDREKITFDTTLAALEFKSLTGIALHELDDLKKVEEAIVNLNNNIDALLRFEADTAAEYVSYYPERLTSTGQSLVKMLCTVRAMSGTTWNTPCFPSSLAKNFEPAVGTEGQIAEAILSRTASKDHSKTYAHIIKSTGITDILKELLEKHPQKNRVRVLMDSGALFKNYSNTEVAKAIRDYLNIPVLFFMRNPRKNEKTPDTLALLRPGSNQPEIIGGTRLEDIQKTGYNIQDYFVFDDDRHTTGTDIPFTPDAIGLMTLDESMLRRSLFQTIMRERDFFLYQDVEFIIPEYLVEILNKTTNENNENKDLQYILSNLILSIKNQAIAKSKHYYRSCKQKMDSVFRESLMKDFLIDRPLTLGYIQAQFPAYQKTTLTVQSDRPYDQFGALEYPIDSMETLTAYRNRKLKLFPENHSRRNEIENKTQEILTEAEISPYRPEKVIEALSKEKTDDMGMQVDVLTEVAAEVNQETDQDIDQEILDELSIYQSKKYNSLKFEKKWKDNEIVHLITSIKNNGATDLKKLNDLLNPELVDFYQKDYSKVFSDTIRITESWENSTNRSLPVFHSMQRPMNQLLIIKDQNGLFHPIALSQNEANQFKTYLNQHQEISKNVWLVQPDGSPLEDTLAGNLPMDDLQIQKILVEVNVFNGEIEYLDAHEVVSTQWLTIDNEKCVDIKKHFLKLKVAKNKIQKRLFFRSEIFGGAHTQQNIRKFRWQLAAGEISNLDEKQIQALTEDDQQKLKLLNPEQLNMLKPSQVRLLQGSQIQYLTKPDLIKKIPQKFVLKMQNSQMDKLAPEQVPWFNDSLTKTQSMPSSYIPHMTDEQIKNLSTNQVMQIEDKDLLQTVALLNPSLLAHVTADQVKKELIEENQVNLLRKKEAIAALKIVWLPMVNKSLREQHLYKTQVAQLNPQNENQQKLIRDLSETQVKWLVNEGQLLALLPIQIAWLTPEQIQQHVRSKDMVQNLGKNVAHLNPDAVMHIVNDQAPYLSNLKQVRALKPEQYHLLKDETLIHSLKVPQDGAIIIALANNPDSKKLLSADQKKWAAKNKEKSTFNAVRSNQVADDTAPEVVNIEPSLFRGSDVSKESETHSLSALKQEVHIEAQKMSITQIVLLTLTGIVATGIVVAGAFALIGSLWINAPQFTVVIFHVFQSPLFMPCAATGVGTLLLVGLVTYAIDKCRHPRKVHSTFQKRRLLKS